MFTGEFRFKTKVPAEIGSVWNFFVDINNLVRISIFPKVKVLKHAGTLEGRDTELQLNFLLFKQKWNLVYVEVQEEQFFIDKSTKVPFPFKSWQHKHSFEAFDRLTIMTDIVKYESYLPIGITNIILYGMFKSRQTALKKHLK